MVYATLLRPIVELLIRDGDLTDTNVTLKKNVGQFIVLGWARNPCGICIDLECKS